MPAKLWKLLISHYLVGGSLYKGSWKHHLAFLLSWSDHWMTWL